MGATLEEAKSVLEAKRLDGRKLTALKFWKLVTEGADERLKVTPLGRTLSAGDADEIAALLKVIGNTRPYAAIVERAAHRQEDSLSTVEVGAHWHDHFSDQVSNSERILKDQAVCFFHIASGAGLGTLVPGRKGHPTRFSFAATAVASFASMDTSILDAPVEVHEEARSDPDHGGTTPEELSAREADNEPLGSTQTSLGQAIFIAHGKKRKPLEQLKKILDEFHIPYKVAVEEPNLGRPISAKVREIMQSCNCAILLFTGDEELTDKDGKAVLRPSENVVFELGASGYLYDNRIVIIKEEGVSFPTNFRDIGYISFAPDELSAKAMDILKELIGFGIVKVST